MNGINSLFVDQTITYNRRSHSCDISAASNGLLRAKWVRQPLS